MNFKTLFIHFCLQIKPPLKILVSETLIFIISSPVKKVFLHTSRNNIQKQ